MAVAQLISNNVVVNVIVLPDGSTISANGETANLPEGTFAAPSGQTLMMQAGAGIGWTLSNGVLSAPALSAAQLRAYANSKANALLATPRTYALFGGPSVLADATVATGVDLNGLMVWGEANPSATTSWVDDNGGVTSLTGAQCVALALAVLAYAQSVYAALASAMTGISGGSITTTAAIAALAWPT